MLALAACSQPASQDDVSEVAEAVSSAPPAKASAPAPAKPAAPTAADEEAAIRAMFAGAYANYTVPFGDHDKTREFTMSPDLKRVVDRATGNTSLDYDPYCACQDYGEDEFTYRVTRLTVNGSSADAEVMVAPFGGAGETRKFRLVKIGGKWLVDDIDGLKADAAAAAPGDWQMG